MVSSRELFLKKRRLSEEFYVLLHEIDSQCDAWLDEEYSACGSDRSGLLLPASCRVKGAIHIISERIPGTRILELTVERRPGESNETLENRTIKKLKECDIWKRFGRDGGDRYSDYMENHDDMLRESLDKEARDKRIGNLLDNHGDTLVKIKKECEHYVGIGAKRLLNRR